MNGKREMERIALYVKALDSESQGSQINPN